MDAIRSFCKVGMGYRALNVIKVGKQENYTINKSLRLIGHVRIFRHLGVS
jgi:hypothetical protein